MEKLTISDLNIILESLKYSKLKFENYPIGKDGYQSYEIKQKRIQEVEGVINKVRDIINNNKKEKPATL